MKIERERKYGKNIQFWKGVTLILLAITIIVLLIILGVNINSLMEKMAVL